MKANLLLSCPPAQAVRTVKGQHGSSGSRHMGTFTGKWQLLLPSHSGYTPTPCSLSGGSSPSGVMGAGLNQGGGCQLGLGFAAGTVLLPAPWQAAPRPTRQGKAPPWASYLWHKYHRQLHFRFLRLHQWSCFIWLQWIPIIQVINLNSKNCV